jgi:hypothetical protein
VSFTNRITDTVPRSRLKSGIIRNSYDLISIVHALQNKNKLNQRMNIPGNIYSGIESTNALDCAENGASR